MINMVTPQEQVTFLIQILSKLHSQIANDHFIKQSTALSISKRQFEILKILFVSGSFSVSDLANFLVISRPAASKSVDNLVEHGLVERSTPKLDRRKVMVTLLPKGKRIIKRYFEILHHHEADLLSHFNVTDLKYFAEILHRYITLLMEEYKDKADLICLSCNTSFSKYCPLVERGRVSCYHTLVEPQLEI